MAGSKAAIMPPKPPALHSIAAQGFVTIEIGDIDPKKYYVHRALLVYHSEYFRKALQGPWKEAEDGVVKLKDVNYRAFSVFVHWLYTQKLPRSAAKDYDNWDDIMDTDKTTPWFENVIAMIEAYGFGDRILAAKFRRATYEVIVPSLTHHSFEPEAVQKLVKFAFKTVPSHHPLLQLLVDEFCGD